jgi:hypothetical protein
VRIAREEKIASGLYQCSFVLQTIS